MHSNAAMPIPFTANLLVECWIEAEEKTRYLLEKKYWDAGEEFITELFHGELRESLEEHSRSKKFENTFLSDLQNYFSEFEDEDLQRFTKGVEAKLVQHTRYTEGKTGGDFGLLVVRPSIQCIPVRIGRGGREARLILGEQQRRGLLCQAKLRSNSSKSSARWGSFTTTQKKILPDRLSYLGLLLYEYIDGENKELNSFYWQLCNGVDFDEVKKWFKLNKFPNRENSESIIKKLCDGTIGTSSSEIIDNCIAPFSRKFLTIEIGWEPDEPPPNDPFYLKQTSRLYRKQQIDSRSQIRHKN